MKIEIGDILIPIVQDTPHLKKFATVCGVKHTGITVYLQVMSKSGNIYEVEPNNFTEYTNEKSLWGIYDREKWLTDKRNLKLENILK